MSVNDVVTAAGVGATGARAWPPPWRRLASTRSAAAIARGRPRPQRRRAGRRASSATGRARRRRRRRRPRGRGRSRARSPTGCPAGRSPTPAAVRRRGAATAVVVGWTARRARCSSVADTVKPTSRRRRSRRLRALGLDAVLLTGDNAATRQAVGRAVGHRATSIAEVMPADKVAVVERLQAAGPGGGHGRRRGQRRRRAGPGRPRHRDGHAAPTSPSRPATSRSCAPTCAPRPTPSSCPGARSRTIKGNLFWAFAYNVAAIPLAMAGLLSPGGRRRGDGRLQRVRRHQQPPPPPLPPQNLISTSKFVPALHDFAPQNPAMRLTGWPSSTLSSSGRVRTA